MTVTRIQVLGRAPFAAGHSFGAAGHFERVDAVLHFAVDPGDPANAGIVDLDLAARGADGRVHFRGDLCLLQPSDPARANGRLLVEVPNRGRRGALARFNRPAPAGMPALPTGDIAVGDGLLLNRGWTVAWVGWQWDVIRTAPPDGLLGFDAPPALDQDGKPIQGRVMLQWQPDQPLVDKLLADRVHQPYRAALPDETEATLAYRPWPDAPRVEIPRQRWRFARDEGGRPVADDTRVWLEGGFQPGLLYELIYTTSACPVVGAGLLAIRDGVAFLRDGGAEAGNPCAGRIEHTIGFGSSQVGRLLRHFLYLGLNVDEAGRQVFDGLFINVAGARRGEFNHRYAQPSVITTPSFGHLPPFGFDAPDDPGGAGAGTADGETDGLLRRQRARGGVPRIISCNTSSEYWNREASLLHTDASGTHDVEPPPEVRVYHFAGTKHAPGTLEPEAGDDAAPADSEIGQRPNVVDFRPLLRAVLLHLERWVTQDIPPPPSIFPRLADGTAARPGDVLNRYRIIPGAAVPDPERLYVRRRLDLGPQAVRGAGRFPAREGEPYVWYVSAVDADGNEVAGIRLPDVAVPVATHTGWSPRRPAAGGAGQNVDMLGSTIPFASDAATRRRRGDPRPSIAERYGSRDEYHARAREAAEGLVVAGYLFPEDLELVVENAVARFDAFVRSAPERGGPAQD